MNLMNLRLLRSCSSLVISNKLIWNNSKTHSLIKRFLYVPQSFKIDAFQNARKNFTKIKDVDKFKTTINSKCERDVDYMIFLEEVKDMLMICETDDDLKLLLRMVKKYCVQTNIIRFGSFSVGPEIMRLFYILNKPKEALDLMKDPDINKIFNETTSLLMLGDLLFKNKMYEEGINFFHLVEGRQFHKKKYPPNLIILFFASCYKLNSRKSYEEAKKMVELFKQIDLKIPLRAVLFYSALAVNQKDVEEGLQILNSVMDTSVEKNIKALAFLENKEFDKLFDLLNKIALNDDPKKNMSNSTLNDTEFIAYDTFQQIEKALQETNDENFKIFKEIKEKLIASNLISTEPLEYYLLKAIKYEKKYNKEDLKATQRKNY